MEDSMRTLPENPSLEHLKTQAKDLLSSFRAGDPEAIDRLRAALPALQGQSREQVAAYPAKLHDAQSAIAREYGEKSWANLADRVETMRQQGHDLDRLVEQFARWAVAPANFGKAERLLELSPKIADAGAVPALLLGDPEAVRRHVRPDQVNTKIGPLEWEPLLYACYSRYLRRTELQPGFEAVVRWLLEQGANPNVSWWDTVWEFDETAIYGASGFNNAPGVARLLLEAGANPNDGESLYHSTEWADHACLDLLLEFGAGKDQPNVVHHMLDREDPIGLRKLLAAGLDANAGIEPSKNTPLHWAVLNGRSAECVRVLVEFGAELDAINGDGLTPYRLAVRLGRTELAETLDKLGATTLLTETDRLIAVGVSGDRDAAARLLGEKPNLAESLSDGEQYALWKAAWDGNAQAVRTMLDMGFRVDILGDMHSTPLHAAAWKGHAEVVEAILPFGPPLELRDGAHQSTPLGWAVHGADFARDAKGDPLNPEADYPRVVRALLAAGCKPDERMLATELEEIATLLSAATKA